MLEGIGKNFLVNPQLLVWYNNFWKTIWPDDPQDLFVYDLYIGDENDLSVTITAAEFEEKAYEKTNFSDKYKIPETEVTRVISKIIVLENWYGKEFINTAEQEELNDEEQSPI